MSDFRPPIDDQLFLLKHIVRLDDFPDKIGEELIASILEGIGRFASDVCAPLDRIGDTVGALWTEGGVVMPDGYRAAYEQFVDGGWGAIGAPASVEGYGLPASVASAVLESVGTTNPAFALAPMLTVGAVEALERHGNATQRQIYLPKLVSGEWTGTMNLTEPQAGSDVGALSTTATPRGDGTWAVRGSKIFISFGDHDLTTNIVHLVLARTPGSPAGTKGISLFLVPKFRLDERGDPDAFNDVRAISIEHKLGLHGSPTCALSFGDDNDCVGELIGDEYGGMAAMFTMMNNARLNVALQGVEVAERATQQAVAYACERVQSPRAGSNDRAPVPIVEHPDVRRMLLRMKALTQASRALVYYSFGQLDRAKAGDAAAAACLAILTPLAKAYATDAANEVASLGIQVHGGVGYIEETGAAQHFRDARIFAIYEGTNGIQAADLVGRKLSMNDGAVVFALLRLLREGTRDTQLWELISDCEDVARKFLALPIEERLAGSYAFLNMMAVATCGWLMEESSRFAATAENTGPFHAMKIAASRFYVEQIVAEARGLKAAALAGSALLYSVSVDDLAA